MFSLLRLFEVVIYSLVNFLPYLFLVLYPLSDHLRFSKKVTACSILFLSALQIGLGLFSTFTPPENGPVLTFICTVCYLTACILSVNDQPGKLLFMILISSNVANLVVMAGKCLEGLLFPDMALQSNRWTFSLTSLIVQAIVLPPVFLFIKKSLKHAVLLQRNKDIWKYLWLIPATFYLFWYFNLYFNSLSALQLALKPTITLYTLLVNLGAFFIYFIVAHALEQADQNLKLQSDNYLLSLQTLQYENLKDRMDEIREARHDMRQHFRVIRNFAVNKEYEHLQDYLEECLNNTYSDRPISYCSHFALNALILYYAQFADLNHIDFSVDISVSPNISVSDTDLTVLFGNLIENACDACLQVPQETRTVSLKIKIVNQEILVFSVDNSCTNAPLTQDKGRVLSYKHEGYGIGTESVRNIVSRHDGHIQFKKKNETFHVSGMMNL